MEKKNPQSLGNALTDQNGDRPAIKKSGTVDQFSLYVFVT